MIGALIRMLIRVVINGAATLKLREYLTNRRKKSTIMPPPLLFIKNEISVEFLMSHLLLGQGIMGSGEFFFLKFDNIDVLYKMAA